MENVKQNHKYNSVARASAQTWSSVNLPCWDNNVIPQTSRARQQSIWTIWRVQIGSRWRRRRSRRLQAWPGEVRSHGKQWVNKKMRGQCHGRISRSRMCPGRGRLMEWWGESKLKATTPNKGREGPLSLKASPPGFGHSNIVSVDLAVGV